MDRTSKSNPKVPWGVSRNFFRLGGVCAKGSEIQPTFVSNTHTHGLGVVRREGAGHGDGLFELDLTVRRSREERRSVLGGSVGC